jgi:hypothetical protein
MPFRVKWSNPPNLKKPRSFRSGSVTSEYTVKFEVNVVSANNPRAAAEEILSWLRQGDFNGTWDVTDEESGETVSVDLDEFDTEEED